MSGTEPTAAEIEAAAQAVADQSLHGRGQPWKKMPEYLQDGYRRAAAAALQAALPSVVARVRADIADDLVRALDRLYDANPADEGHAAAFDAGWRSAAARVARGTGEPQ